MLKIELLFLPRWNQSELRTWKHPFIFQFVHSRSSHSSFHFSFSLLPLPFHLLKVSSSAKILYCTESAHLGLHFVFLHGFTAIKPYEEWIDRKLLYLYTRG